MSKSKSAKSLDHNLVNSLYVIKGIAESCLDQMKQDHASPDSQALLSRAQSALSETMQQANRIIEMIHHFRALTQASRRSREKAGAAGTSIHDAVRQVIHAMQYEFPMERITLLKILPHDLGRIPVALEHLETILFQLIYNARQAIGETDGIITIEACETLYASPENKNQRRFVLRVSDTGTGIAEENLPHLFDPFFSTKDARTGNGLGLYIVKKIVDGLRGTIRVETSPPRGTSFYIEIPA